MNKGTKGAIAITAIVITLLIVLALYGWWTGSWDVQP